MFVCVSFVRKRTECGLGIVRGAPSRGAVSCVVGPPPQNFNDFQATFDLLLGIICTVCVDGGILHFVALESAFMLSVFSDS